MPNANMGHKVSLESQSRGSLAYHTGLAAEGIVERDYLRRAHDVAARRWRGTAGEIDLILRDGATLVFVEVKKARDFAIAASRIGQRQIDRIFTSANEFLGGEPEGLLTDVRFDLALVDQQGRLNVMENAFA